MLLVCRFTVPDAEADAFAARAATALRLFTAQPGCRSAQVGRAPDDASRWVLTARFDSVVAYRRAMSPFAVREHVVPLLSEAVTGQPATFEVLADATDGTVTEYSSILSRE